MPHERLSDFLVRTAASSPARAIRFLWETPRDVRKRLWKGAAPAGYDQALVDEATAAYERAAEARDFTTDWFSFNLWAWIPVLAPLRDEPVRILEIGSFEGRSALFFMQFLPQSTLTSIDPYDLDEERVRLAKGRFARNLADYSDRVVQHLEPSQTALPRLLAEGERFDIAYVDGDHSAPAVWQDANAVWPLVKPGGLVIFDDYLWEPTKPAEDTPTPAINRFLNAAGHDCDLVHAGYQCIVRKRR